MRSAIGATRSSASRQARRRFDVGVVVELSGWLSLLPSR